MPWNLHLTILLPCIGLCGCHDKGLTMPAGQPDIGEGDWMAVTAGRDFTCALTFEGAAYCWGANYDRLLGTTSAEAEVPTPTAVRGGLTFRAISAGYDHVCALTVSGAAYCWGSSRFGKLGAAVAGLEKVAGEPTPVSGGLTFVSISAGLNHTCGVSQAGAAYCWGSDAGGALGVGGTAICTPGPHDDATANDFDQVCIRLEPTAIVGGETFLSISAGDDFTCGVQVDGTAYCWGDNHYGTLGDPATPSNCDFTNHSACRRFVPAPVAGGLRFTSVSAGRFHTCGVTVAGSAYCWGLAGAEDPIYDYPTFTRAPLGTGSTAPGGSRVPVPVIGGLSFRTVSARWQSSCGTTTDAHAYCWGSNSFGDLGLGDDGGPVAAPHAVRMPAARYAPALGHEEDHACALTTTGRIFCWGGYNFSGELGTGVVGGIGARARLSSTPKPVVSPVP